MFLYLAHEILYGIINGSMSTKFLRVKYSHRPVPVVNIGILSSDDSDREKMMNAFGDIPEPNISVIVRLIQHMK